MAVNHTHFRIREVSYSLLIFSKNSCAVYLTSGKPSYPVVFLSESICKNLNFTSRSVAFSFQITLWAKCFSRLWQSHLFICLEIFISFGCNRDSFFFTKMSVPLPFNITQSALAAPKHINSVQIISSCILYFYNHLFFLGHLDCEHLLGDFYLQLVKKCYIYSSYPELLLFLSFCCNTVQIHSFHTALHHHWIGLRKEKPNLY